MPGFSQLKKFSDDLISLGDESSLRASRGERIVRYEIPKTIEDKDDSEDFVLGMPEVVAEVVDTQVDDDLSDIMGMGTEKSTDEEGESETAAPSFEAPDLSNLLNPIGLSEGSSEDNMPDFSMFMEPEEPEVEEEEEEPEEVSIADMGLEALLAGGGFDEPEESEEDNTENYEDSDEFLETYGPKLDFENPSQDFSQDSDIEDELLPLDDLKVVDFDNSSEEVEEIAEEITEAPTEDVEENGNVDEISAIDDFGISGVNTDDDLQPPEAQELETDFSSMDMDELSDLNLGEVSELSDSFDLPDSTSLESTEDFNLPFDNSFDLPESDDFSESLDTISTPGDDFSESSNSMAGLGDESVESSFNESDLLLNEVSNLIDLPTEEQSEEIADASDLTDMSDMSDINNFENQDLSFDLPDMDSDLENLGDAENQDFNDFSLDDSLQNVLPEDDSTLQTFETDLPEESNLQDLGNFEQADTFDLPDDLDSFATTSSSESKDFDFDANLESSNSFDLPDDLGTINDETANSADVDDFGSNIEGLDNLDSFGFDNQENQNDKDDKDDFGSISPTDLFNSADVEIPDYDDANTFGLDSESFENSSEESGESEEFDYNSFDENGEIETFDTSEMEGLDFDIPDTDSQLGGQSSDFDLGSSDDFPMEGGFEIPGFSDVETAKEEKSTTKLVNGKNKPKKSKKIELDEPDFEGAVESEDLPPNTLSDAQYKQFLKNLFEYPLNVRLAFEDLIVQDEFTDDAEFEVIEKILQKAPARQVASTLEKMLDIPIPVPRDFEHRTAEEYEAYKKSISYQLRNKIIPGIILFTSIVLVGVGLFNFGKNCIYKPLKANSLYKQGYALLEATEYPQSEMKFEEAADIRLNRKWFYKYARGYRKHKQYKRAETMYKNILYCFNHDKEAGLEYAGMELNDLANYEKAENIVRREVLDYHINDPDGILLLGDVFLEWGTEKDSSKLENAREQYATLIQLYKPNDLYLSRMMRYFIRSDNLREVLQLKQTFEPREKSLGWEDWTELSGYLLDKYYGPIAPADEYLRYQIEGLRKLLLRAVNSNTNNPIALYNLSRYFVQTNETKSIESTLKDCIEKFNALDSIKRRDIYKYIDSYRLLGEHYINTQDYLQALEQFAEGIHLYTTERDNAGFAGTPQIGKLYEDFANIKYFVSGDYDEALINFKNSVELENDSPEIRYKIGYIQYKNKNYLEALGSFMKAGEGQKKERNLLLAMANTLALRGDDYAAEGYYEHLLNNLDLEIADRGLVFPQVSEKDYDIVNTYLYAANNYGVTLHRLAKRTGNSGLNAQSLVQLSQSVRAWDALTRNQETLVRLEGSNLAEQNIKYITSRVPDYEPSIYIDIKKTLNDKESF